MKQQYIEYLTPGAIMADTWIVPVDSGAMVTPDRARGYRQGWREEREVDGELLTGPYHWERWTYIGVVQTIDDVRKRGRSILLSNMECNKWDRVVNVGGNTYPLFDGESVIPPEHA